MRDKTSEERINKMIDAFVRVARGDYSVQLELSGKDDDLDSLAVGLNMLVDDVRNSVEELKQANKELKQRLQEINGLNTLLQRRLEEELPKFETCRDIVLGLRNVCRDLSNWSDFLESELPHDV